MTKCKTCCGTGSVEKVPRIAAYSEHGDREQEPCNKCHGSGNQLLVCSYCRGTGGSAYDPCDKCGGSGRSEPFDSDECTCEICGDDLIMSHEEATGICDNCLEEE